MANQVFSVRFSVHCAKCGQPIEGAVALSAYDYQVNVPPCKACFETEGFHGYEQGLRDAASGEKPTTVAPKES